MFSPLRAETVVLAATFIQHALEEYAAGGTKLINKMQTSVIRSMYDHIDTIIY
jgi:CO/xanthine dehydrogenase FAD-binding subunit